MRVAHRGRELELSTLDNHFRFTATMDTRAIEPADATPMDSDTRENTPSWLLVSMETTEIIGLLRTR